MNPSKVSYCPYCKEHGVNNPPKGLRCAPYYSAYISREKTECEYCNRPLTKMNITVFEFETILQISGDSSFIEAMDELKQKDIIEFNLKMSQFKSQVSQTQQQQQQQDNTPKCPTCGSTNLKRISITAKAVNIAMFGLLGNKRKYQWHCNNCKSDF